MRAGPDRGVESCFIRLYCTKKREGWARTVATITIKYQASGWLADVLGWFVGCAGGRGGRGADRGDHDTGDADRAAVVVCPPGPETAVLAC
jgi:hypothetical protein